MIQVQGKKKKNDLFYRTWWWCLQKLLLYLRFPIFFLGQEHAGEYRGSLRGERGAEQNDGIISGAEPAPLHRRHPTRFFVIIIINYFFFFYQKRQHTGYKELTILRKGSQKRGRAEGIPNCPSNSAPCGHIQQSIWRPLQHSQRSFSKISFWKWEEAKVNMQDTEWDFSVHLKSWWFTTLTLAIILRFSKSLWLLIW